MAIVETGEYWFVRFLLQRGLAAIYLIAFLVAAFQFRPLSGEDGLLPLGQRLERQGFRESPSLFALLPDDRVIGAAAYFGVGLSLLALFGVPSALGTAATVTVWGLLWALYLSFVNSGGRFYGFGWESMLLESGFLAIFLGASGVATPDLVVWLFRWLLFRNMFGAGLIKIRGDQCWRDLTCMDYHYETQPLPNPLSWFAHHLPDRFHRVEVLGNHVVELAIPFLYFAPQPIAGAAGMATILFQGWLILTGNFAWLNWLSVVLAFSTLSDRVIEGVLTSLGVIEPVTTLGGSTAPPPTLLVAAVAVLTVVVLALSYYPVRNMCSPAQRMNASFDPLHIVNSYGAFGSITTRRHEIVIEGTQAADPDADDWKPYTCRAKPNDTGSVPPQVAPYHYRLDWQLWFAAMTPSPTRHPWFESLLGKLLAGDAAVENLFADVPFDEPPRAIRAERYRYRFTTPTERAETGEWWVRERVGTYHQPVCLDDRRFRRRLERLGVGLSDAATVSAPQPTGQQG
jgi:hypothetical protein